MQPEPLCPCGRITRLSKPGKPGKPFTLAQCCGRYLSDFAVTPAPSAEALMRSRYSAFALSRADYLSATWHASTRPTDFGLDASCKWLGLEVRSDKLIDADHAEVEFVARYKTGGRATRLHERSRFVREQGMLCMTLADLRQADRDGLQGVFLKPIAGLLVRKTTQQTARVRLIAGRAGLCRASQARWYYLDAASGDLT